ncbi:MAG: endonuclease III [Gemmatimonadota bacterium]
MTAAEESPESKRARAEAMAPILAEAYPELEITLDWSNPLELIVATILSAQCTDERVRKVTAELFPRYRTAEDYAGADREELEKLVRPTGFFRNKAKHIQGMARKVVEEHGGEVPDTMEGLVELPGVARKTANVVLTNAFGKVSGVVVDTHVRRVSRRMGFATSKTASAIEKELMEVLPEEQWHPFAWRLILHGREVCHGRKDPECDRCPVAEHCPSAFTFGD